MLNDTHTTVSHISQSLKDATDFFFKLTELNKLYFLEYCTGIIANVVCMDLSERLRDRNTER